MQKIILILIILLVVNLPCNQSRGQIIGLELDSGSILTITPPGAVTYTLTDPLNSGNETLSSNETVTLTGNGFDNTTSQPYITVSIAGGVTNATFTLTGITRSAIGTVTVDRNNPAQVALSAAATAYANPDKTQRTSSGTIIGNHQLIITKSGIISAGTYPLMLNWIGYDSGV